MRPETASAGPGGTLHVEPVTGMVGAEIGGVDLSRPIGASVMAELRAALDTHLVLFFRDQNLTPLQLKAFVGTFGPIFLHPRVKGLAEAPEVLELRKEPGGTLFAGEDWHADVTWQKPSGYVSVLHGLEIPSAGGDTCFASLIAAFDSLSGGMKALLRKLQAVHTYKMQTAPGVFEDRTAIHPVVRRHPVTGREGFYLNGMFVTHFEGLTADESRPLLSFLLGKAVRPEFTCRFRWKKGSVAMWDNRFTLHLPVNDFNAERRVMIRATALEPSV